MRIDVKKFLFVGLEESKDHFFKEAQEKGVIHFIDSTGEGKEEPLPLIIDIVHAIKVLRGLPRATQVKGLVIRDELDRGDRMTHAILKHRHDILKFDEKIRVLNLDIARVLPFGDYSRDDLKNIADAGHFVIQFFCAKAGLKDTMPDYPGLVYVSSDEVLDYFISFTSEPVQYEKMVEMKIDKTVGELKEELINIQEARQEEINQLQEYAPYDDFLHQLLYYHLNKVNLEGAKKLSNTPLDGLFVVEGWVPDNKRPEIMKLAETSSVIVSEVAIEPEDRVPTYLENKNYARVGEDLVGIYDTPGTTDKDPSMWVLLSFGVFFGFIVGDGGYGLIYLAFFLWLKWKYPDLTGLKKRIVKLGLFLSVCCILWGVITNSYFGIALGQDNPLRTYSPLSWMAGKKMDWLIANKDPTYVNIVKTKPELAAATDSVGIFKLAPDVMNKMTDNVLLEMAIFFGVVHSLLGMGRYLTRNWSLLGWMLFLIGGFLYFPYYLGVPSLLNYVFNLDYAAGAKQGLIMLYTGIGLAVLIAIYRHRWLGLAEVMKVIEIFADVLSYLRLYALGLAGAIVGGVINDAAGSLPAVLAIILAILAHSVNMGLGIMSGVIHGLRLNFIEWYHYSFEGGGKKFKALEMHKND